MYGHSNDTDLKFDIRFSKSKKEINVNMKTTQSVPETKTLPFSEIKDSREVGVIYTNPVWDIVKNKLNLNIVSETEIQLATVQCWETLLQDVKGEVIYAVGGGLPVDAGKYISLKKNVPLVSLPTALSVDAFFTYASGIRVDGCVEYIETKTPDLVILDLDVIGSAPKSILAAGICDVLSIATGNWDWKYADSQNKNPENMKFITDVSRKADTILQEVIECSEFAGKGEPEGLKKLTKCLIDQVILCNEIGHARPEEGSEHYFAYSAENYAGAGLPHGDLVGPGILIMSAIQGQDISSLKTALKNCHIPLDTIPEDIIIQTMLDLPNYCSKHNLPYGIAHDLDKDKIGSVNIKNILS